MTRSTTGYGNAGKVFAVAAAGMLLAAFAPLGAAADSPAPKASGPKPSGPTASDPSRMTRSGFLTDYAKLKVGPDSEVACWRVPDLNAKQYDKIMIARIVVSLKTDPKKAIDPAELKALVDYFHASLVNAMKPQMQIVNEPGPGVLVMKTALTGLVPTDSARSLMGTAVPFGFVAEGGSGVATGRPVGSTPYLGETGVEIQFTDDKGKILAECADTQIGRKYTTELDKGAVNAAKSWASGYMGSFQAWTYAKEAFDKWSALLAKRIGALRAA